MIDFNVSGAAVEVERYGVGDGDFVVDGDVVEAVVGAFADVNGVAGLGDGWVFNDTTDAGVDVAKSAPGGVDVADDVDLGVAAGMDADVAGAGGDVEVGRAGDVEGAVEGVAGKSGGRDGEQGREKEQFEFHGGVLVLRG